jgi:transposase-like protein
VLYTTYAIESVSMSLRKITKNRGSLPCNEALLKLFYLALRNISKSGIESRRRTAQSKRLSCDSFRRLETPAPRG